MPDAQKWTFSRLQAAEPTGGIASSGAVSSVPPGCEPRCVRDGFAVPARGRGGDCHRIIGSSSGKRIARSFLCREALHHRQSHQCSLPTMRTTRRTIATTTAWDAQNGGCTYSYGADNDTDISTTGDTTRATAVVTTGTGSEQRSAITERSATAAGAMPPPPDYPSMPPGLR